LIVVLLRMAWWWIVFSPLNVMRLRRHCKVR
jgi:hypothetical protein